MSKWKEKQSLLEQADRANIKLAKELQQYINIERELGIDLITLFKALKNGIYWKGTTSYNTSGIFFEEHPILDFESKCFRNILFLKNLGYVLLKNYGKTWALTREELEHV